MILENVRESTFQSVKLTDINSTNVNLAIRVKCLV